MTKEQKIGVFDSGVGGLFSLANLKKVMPDVDFIYLADTANLPYGSKNKEELTSFAKNVINFFEEKPVNTVVVACNTLSSVLLETRLKSKQFNWVDVIVPAVLEVKSTEKNVGVIATEYTIKSGIYKKILTSVQKNSFEIACPNLVNLIESGRGIDIIKEELFNYLSKFKLSLDCLILGCTHYGMLKNQAAEFFERKVRIIDTNCSVVKAVQSVTKHSSGGGEIEFFVTGEAEKFIKIAKPLFDFNFDNVVEVDL